MTYQRIDRTKNLSHIAQYSAEYARMRNTQQLVADVRYSAARRAFLSGATVALITVTALVSVITLIANAV